MGIDGIFHKEEMGQEVIRWVGFHILIIFLLMLDIGVFHQRRHEIKLKEALGWSGFWVALSLLFNAYVYFYAGPEKALEFFTGYLIEKSLSIDNIFIFIVIFSYFEVPIKDQHRALFHGILMACILRLGLILAGAALLNAFIWMKYFFGLFIGFTGVKLILQKEHRYSPESNPLVRWAIKRFRVTKEYHHGKYFIMRKGALFATPLFLVLLVVESTDLVFALDSVPAILAITTDRFIVYTSNIFAILGLRSLYFVIARFMSMFRYLKIGLGSVLIYIGMKLGVSSYLHIPLGLSLLIVATILGISVIYSLRKR